MKTIIKIFRKKAQAAAETAIFGGLLILVLGSLVTYSQSLNQIHSLKMESFRNSLAKAYEDNNGGTGYTILRHKRNTDIRGPFAKGYRNEVSSSASVLWCRGLSENYAWWEVDGAEIELQRIKKTIEDDDGNTEQKYVPIEIYKTESNSTELYAYNFSKTESPAVITTRKVGALQDQVATKLYGRFNRRRHHSDPDSYIYDVDNYTVDSIYSGAGDTTWITPH